MSSTSGFKIYPSWQRETPAEGGIVYEGLYTIEDEKGVRGDPITVAGRFESAEEALAAAQAAGDKVLAQMH